MRNQLAGAERLEGDKLHLFYSIHDFLPRSPMLDEKFNEKIEENVGVLSASRHRTNLRCRLKLDRRAHALILDPVFAIKPLKGGIVMETGP